MIIIKPYQHKKISTDYDATLASNIMKDAYTRGMVTEKNDLILGQIRKQIIKSKEYGFRTEYAYAIFVFASLCFGTDFDTDTRYTFSTVLNNQMLSADVKAKMVDQLCQQEKVL